MIHSIVIRRISPNAVRNIIARDIIRTSSSVRTMPPSLPVHPVRRVQPTQQASQFRSHSSLCPSIEDENTSINNTFTSALLSKKASVRRTFSPKSNAQAMLVCGGEELAAHASFDPEYKRAKGYIQNHAVGPAVLSPILISGLIGALIESTLPQSVFVSASMNQCRPLIVGVEVEASIEVVSVYNCSDRNNNNNVDDDRNNEYCGFERYNGFELSVDTKVKRVTDGATISNGNQTIWLPDYGNYY